MAKGEKILRKINNIKSNKEDKSIIEKIKSSDKMQCYLLLALPIIGFLVFTIYPIIWSVLKSFYYYDLVPNNTRFVGIDNFKTLFAKGIDYWKGWVVTIKFGIPKLLIEIPLALILATILSKGLKGSNIIRNIFYLPCVISLAIVGIMFTNLFDPFGVINAWMLKLGWISKPIDWFGKTNSALFVLILGGIWANFGTNVIYFTAALSNVPKELYEASYIEGAGRCTRFFKITIPMISKVFQTILLLAINGTLRVGEYIIVMTNGAPARTTLTAEAYVMKSFLPGFASGMPNLGYGCAMSIISSVICALVGIIYMRATKKISDLY